MILRIIILAVFLNLLSSIAGFNVEVAPEITTVEEGYNIVAKLPCIGCAFLYKDTSKGKNEAWIKREDENALLLNISLPYNAAFLSINNANLLTTSKILPQIHVHQVVRDMSSDDLSKLIDSDELDDLGGGYFGVSYSYSLRRVKSSRALLFQFDIMQLWSDLTTPPVTVVLDAAKQKMLEIVLLQRPLISAGDPINGFEIVRAELVERPESESRKRWRSMWFEDWDVNGKKGTPLHLVNSASDSFSTYASSSAWTLILFLFGAFVFFVVLCSLCIYTCGCCNDDEYERAQQGKRKGGGGNAAWENNDIEKARRFMGADELGFRGSGRVVGVGKSD